MAQRLLNWGGNFALEIAPLLGLAGKLAGATSCCLSTVVTANRAHHATPSYFLFVYKQAHYDDTREGPSWWMAEWPERPHMRVAELAGPASVDQLS